VKLLWPKVAAVSFEGIIAMNGKRKLPILLLIGSILGLLIVVAAIAAGSGVFWLRNVMHASLPQVDGDIHLEGLHSAVSVVRDQHGVPHIEAADLEDLIEAQGYVTAQDRLWEMDMARRIASGDAAEVLGKQFLNRDKMQRLLCVRETAERMEASLPGQDLRFLQAYAVGVNAYIDEHRTTLPAEFLLLRYRPKRWQPIDSVLLSLNMVQLLDQHWRDKLERESITARLGSALSADLYPTESSHDRPPIGIAHVHKLSADRSPDAGVAVSQLDFGDLLSLRETETGSRTPCFGCIPGSNEWVVSGAHSASGKAMLSNDMHLGHQIPNIWYECDLNAGNFHVAGVSIPGLPFVVAGHNTYIAWGLTALNADTQDIYVEQINDKGQYLTEQGWQAIEHRIEIVHVRNGADVSVVVDYTKHGPIVSPLLPHEKRALALKWAAYDQSATGIPLFSLNSAQDWTAFRSALRTWWGPTLNFVYADDQGHIGYQAVGYIPNRPAGLAGTPIVDHHHEWEGFIPFDRLPSVYDPPGGVIATANSRVTPDGYPYQLTLEWGGPYRNERIWNWLQTRKNLTQKDMLSLQTDVYSAWDLEFARHLVYAIDHSKHPDTRLRQAADLLRSWDGRVETDSAAATVVASARAAFWRLLLMPKLGTEWDIYEWDESDVAQENLTARQPLFWLPKGFSSWNEFLAAAVMQGLERRNAPADLRGWSYGQQHPVEIEHPIYGQFPWFKSLTGTGVQPQSGDTTTVKQVGRAFGPSQRFTIDWIDSDSATENIVMGQSEVPLSIWYRDQWPFWYGGTTFALPFSSTAVARFATHTLQLLP
jgi:penicillin G amidase